jgi:hypothetical protein
MIDSVRNTVLSILNKNNYGYISPSDFNLYARQAQLELFEAYFSSINKTVNAENARLAGTDYADLHNGLVVVIENFLESKFLHTKTGHLPADNVFSIPSLITTGDEAFMVNKVIAYTGLITTSTSSAILVNSLTDATKNFITLGVSPGDIVVNKATKKSSTVVAVASATTLSLNNDIFLAIGNAYSIFKENEYSDVSWVSNGKMSLLANSLLTSPSKTFPSSHSLVPILTPLPHIS